MIYARIVRIEKALEVGRKSFFIAFKVPPFV